MKIIYIMLLVNLLACNKNTSDKSPQEDVYREEDKELFTAGEQLWDYSELYGQYLHENNTRGFNAILELNPEGNDLAFTLSLIQGECEAKVDGFIGMIYHGENEYAGFFESEACRLSFNFFLIENQIRIDEIGICRAHAMGCSFGGLYVKKPVIE
ncbi:hypothetical protein QQ054_33640 [Oscillatoria amoena NRMC-F 0135]|nr:hypothetical protein [Oscillatoria amoena NRMC-F 0135]